MAAAAALPDGIVLDGEVLAWNRHGVLPFGVLQTRIGRERLTARTLQEAPAVFLAYDLIEADGEDLRSRPLDRRRARLEAILGAAPEPLRLSPLVAAGDWESLARHRDEARARNVEGLMLKRRGSGYGRTCRRTALHVCDRR